MRSKQKEIPELDDEFVQDVSEFDTVDEYKADVKAKLEEKNRTRSNVHIRMKQSIRS